MTENAGSNGENYLPYRFTGKELDSETGLYYYGARYLDAKYSRWLSCDPALGEYIPHAPISDEAKKHNQNLPGMGGVFNTVNLNLYHYAGNNPVNYIDPDGRTERSGNKYVFTRSEIKFMKEVFGYVAEYIAPSVRVICLPPGRSASTNLFYSRQIWLSAECFDNPLDSYDGINAMMHEMFHQIQYYYEPGGAFSGLDPSAFERLVAEQVVYSVSKIDVYSYGDYEKTDLSQYKTLFDMPYYEAQAQLAGNFAALYKMAKDKQELSKEELEALKVSAEILSNSGFSSEAIKWVKENIE